MSQFRNRHTNQTKLPTNPQVASRQLSSQPGVVTPLCDLSCNASYRFQKDEALSFFAGNTVGNGVLSAVRISSNGTETRLKNTEFTVMAIEVAWNGTTPVATTNTACTTRAADVYVRLFSTKTNTTYFFHFGVNNATTASAKYKMTVIFP